MITIPGTSIVLAADAIESLPTRDPLVWRGMPLTIRLYQPVKALRWAPSHGRLLGDWFALDGHNQSPSQFASGHALPRYGNQARANLKYAGVWMLQRGTELNVGQCGERFGYPGGDFQAEFLDGPLPVLLERRSA